MPRTRDGRLNPVIRIILRLDDATDGNLAASTARHTTQRGESEKASDLMRVTLLRSSGKHAYNTSFDDTGRPSKPPNRSRPFDSRGCRLAGALIPEFFPKNGTDARGSVPALLPFPFFTRFRTPPPDVLRGSHVRVPLGTGPNPGGLTASHRDPTCPLRPVKQIRFHSACRWRVRKRARFGSATPRRSTIRSFSLYFATSSEDYLADSTWLPSRIETTPTFLAGTVGMAQPRQPWLLAPRIHWITAAASHRRCPGPPQVRMHGFSLGESPAR